MQGGRASWVPGLIGRKTEYLQLPVWNRFSSSSVSHFAGSFTATHSGTESDAPEPQLKRSCHCEGCFIAWPRHIATHHWHAAECRLKESKLAPKVPDSSEQSQKPIGIPTIDYYIWLSQYNVMGNMNPNKIINWLGACDTVQVSRTRSLSLPALG